MRSRVYRGLSALSSVVLVLVLLLPQGVLAAPLGAWSYTGSMTVSRWAHTATLLNTGKVLVTGGYSSTGFQASSELYNPATDTFTSTGNMSVARWHHAATRLNDGRVLVAGGLYGGTPLDSAEIYEPTTGTWTSTSPMNTAGAFSAIVLLDTGKVLATGPTTSTELYDPTAETWSLTGSMNTVQGGHTTTLIDTGTNKGKVLVAGGNIQSAAINSAELYDPATGTWSLTGPMNVARTGHSATMLKNGKVLVAGGNYQSAYFNSAELFDPATGTFTFTDSMTYARSDHTATLLDDGRVLVAGGYYNATAEIYDPTTEKWSLAASLNTPRWTATGTLLPGGKVLVAGGYYMGPLASAELFDLTPPTPVPVDVKPKGCPNPLNTGSSGVLPVAILGTSDFDVAKVDLATVELEGVSALPGSEIKDVATPYVPFIGKSGATACTTEGKDGFADLILTFDNRTVAAALGSAVDGDVKILHLTGNLKPEFGSTSIVGEDVIVVVKQ